MVITTSWDDGHPLDIKLVELLNKYGINATFYIPFSNPENKVMSFDQIKNITSFYEIGGHTLNHTYLNKLNELEAKKEINNCKAELEQLTGKEIKAFCFPGGKFSHRDIALIKEAGFIFGRTTRFFNTKIKHESNLMHTTIHAYNHTYVNLLKHCTKRLLFSDILYSKAFIPFSANFVGLSNQYLSNNTEVFHLWGHSWEIEKFNLWNQLEDLFKILSTIPDAQYMNNTECWEYYHK